MLLRPSPANARMGVKKNTQHISMCTNAADLNVPRILESDSERSMFPCVRFVGLTTSLPMMLRDFLKVTELILVSDRPRAESRVS